VLNSSIDRRQEFKQCFFNAEIFFPMKITVISVTVISVTEFIGPILSGHSGPLCHALSLLSSLSSLSSWTSMRRRRATVRQWQRTKVAIPGEWQCKTTRSGEWAQHFSNASCLFINSFIYNFLFCFLFKFLY